MTLVLSIFVGAWEMLLVAAPFLLFGMLLAGVLHVVLSRRWIERLMGRRGLLGVITAAGFGVPLPLCSCSVVPVVLALRRKGASAPASLSFLISAPESGADSIMLTWGMLGPVMAIARPLASFLTALWAGVLTIAADPRDEPPAVAAPIRLTRQDNITPTAIGARPMTRTWSESEGLWEAAARGWISLSICPDQFTEGAAAAEGASLRSIGYGVLRYAFIDLADDIAFWMVVGFLAAGVIVAVVPDDLVGGLGAGPLAMLFLLLISVPLYICASASTPLAAALVAKGVSPGAALVFLLAGPATNTATIFLLTRQFGSRFVGVYLTAIVTASLGVVSHWTVSSRLSAGMSAPSWQRRSQVRPARCSGCRRWSFFRCWPGGWRRARRGRGVAELKAGVEGLCGVAEASGSTVEPRRRFWRQALRRTLQVTTTAAAALYLMSGFHRIPPGSAGYGMLFGRLVWADLEPGLHYVPPARSAVSTCGRWGIHAGPTWATHRTWRRSPIGGRSRNAPVPVNGTARSPPCPATLRTPLTSPATRTWSR